MKNYKLNIALAVTLLVSVCSYAQGPGFVDDVDDVAPIPGIVFAIISALCIGVYSLRKRKNS